ncbi:DNA mismatch repair protein msh7 [Phtheirospermum japonicum]|uniref:DNA mismatch repair protein msh7 n=1 Tax=Phtheirospermum japonicum TaxID=374723 RepID=A0A830CCX9_9LAMI|nr:DNA mismatch repair protein msh7 [Phtheirospermum japonicum]
MKVERSTITIPLREATTTTNRSSPAPRPRAPTDAASSGGDLLETAELSPPAYDAGHRPADHPPPLPPLPSVHAATESPISAYMRFLHNPASSLAPWDGVAAIGGPPHNEFDQRPRPTFSPLQPAESPVIGGGASISGYRFPALNGDERMGWGRFRDIGNLGRATNVINSNRLHPLNLSAVPTTSSILAPIFVVLISKPRQRRPTVSLEFKMQRQKSILSFLKRPETSSGVKPVALDASDDEIKGIDTPPEKVPRQIFADSRPSLFASIKHKFAKFDSSTSSSSDSRFSKDNAVSSQPLTLKFDRPEDLGNRYEYKAPKQLHDQNVLNASTTMCAERDKGCSLQTTFQDDVFGPDTPGMRPLVPRLKRVGEDFFKLDDKADFSVPDNKKRAKVQQAANTLKINFEEDSETVSKFEWLHPSRIKDANGRTPGDPLYDKRTLYVPPDVLKNMTASQRQYWDVKRQYMDVGKFYELYELDAETGHKELDWKITLSGVGKCRQVGVSENGIDDAVQKLIARGYKVGRMEQLETSEQAKSRGSSSIIKRKLIHVLTPATTSEGNIGADAVHLLAVKEDGLLGNGSTVFGFAFVDCAALKFQVGSISDDASCAALGALLMQVSPKEIIYESRGLSKDAHRALKKYSLTGLTPSQLNPSDAFGEAPEVRNIIQSNRYFSGSCDSWHHILDGVVHRDLALCALGGLIGHMSRLMLNDVIRNGDILSYEVYKGFLRMDGQTLVNLEIFNNNADGTLYKYLNNCITSSGKRLLRNWICHPLQDVKKINSRLDVVEDLIANSEITLQIAQSLRQLPDLENMLGRVRSSFQSSSVLFLPLIGNKVLKQRVKVFGSLVRGLRTGMQMLMELQKHKIMTSSLSKVVSLPMLSGSKGLDEFLSQFEAALDSDFPDYQDYNVTGTEAETLSILMELFVEKATQWSQMIHAISCIDVLRSFAISATSSFGAMCRPVFVPHPKSANSFTETMFPILHMQGMWHPYALGENGALPVANDIHLGGGESSYIPGALLLTGPNMGGKSTLLRATCLAVILAQLGCYVPCEKCTLSIVDIIFTRLGATDRIMTGESTFLIECTETASVLQNATQSSLVLLDELGRGTSTFDGYAIAYAVFRHLVESVNCRLLFATHYHPLTKEFAAHPRVKLQHMAYSFDSTSKTSSQLGQKLVFLYRLASGACPESYGMQIALMAGIPGSVVGAALEAGQVMKEMVGESFKASEQREKFSTLHEEWLKALVSIANTAEDDFDDDAYDSLFCLWHELKSSCADKGK